MSDCSRWARQRKIDWFLRQSAQHAGMPFSDVLPAETILSAMETMCLRCYQSIFNPVTVLWLFLNQVIHANPTLAARPIGPVRWLGRTIKVFDGSTVSMPDTPENQKAYPQSRVQTPGVGFRWHASECCLAVGGHRARPGNSSRSTIIRCKPSLPI